MPIYENEVTQIFIVRLIHIVKKVFRNPIHLIESYAIRGKRVVDSNHLRLNIIILYLRLKLGSALMIAAPPVGI